MQISSVNNQKPILNVFGTSSQSKELQAKTFEKNEAYELSISEEAQQAYLAAKRSQMNRLSNPDVTGGAKVSDKLQEQIDAMTKKLNRILLANGIDTSKDINLGVESGKIIVKSNHSEKERIERILNDNEQFANEVHKTLADASLEAEGQVEEKKQARLKEHVEDDEDKKKQENEFERQLRITEKVINISNQIMAVSGDFSLSDGNISFASLTIAAGAVV